MTRLGRVVIVALAAGIALPTMSGCSIFRRGPAGPAVPGEPGELKKLPPVSRQARSEFEAGVRLMRLGAVDVRLAQARFERAVQLDPQFWEAWHNLGLVYVQRQALADADRALQRAMMLQPAPDTIVALADVQKRMGRTAQAINLLRNAVASVGQRGDDIVMRKRLARALRQAKRFGEAISETRTLLSKAPRDIDAYNLLGLIYYDEKRYDMADLVLRKALAIDQNDASTYNNLGLVALARGYDQEAFTHFEKATALAPRLVTARLNKAMVLLACGEFNRAHDDLQKAIEVDPGSLEARIALGVAQRGLKRYPDAARSWEQVLDIDPKNTAALYNLGVLFAEHQREPARAKTYLDRFMDATRRGHPKRADASRRLRELKMSSSSPKTKS